VGGIVANRKMFGTLLPASTTSATPTTRRATPSARPARAWRRTRRRPGAPGGAARRVDHRRRDRRAGGRLHRRADAAQGLPAALREICDKHGILLIFDEVITGFGRTGKPSRQTFGVTPGHDHLAKGITNGAVPMGAVIVRSTSTTPSCRARAPDRVLPRLHLFGPSAGLRRGLATLDTYRRGPADPRQRPAGLLRRRGAFAQGAAQRDRHPQHRPGGRHRAGADAGRAGQARLRHLPGLLRARAC
jgi:beta-alanine--pyruvate transaminase